MTPLKFAQRWKPSTLRERQASQEHFLDICRMLGHPTPARVDADGSFFTFERGASKTSGGDRWADVWKNFFGWEFRWFGYFGHGVRLAMYSATTRTSSSAEETTIGAIHPCRTLDAATIGKSAAVDDQAGAASSPSRPSRQRLRLSGSSTGRKPEIDFGQRVAKPGIPALK